MDKHRTGRSEPWQEPWWDHLAMRSWSFLTGVIAVLLWGFVSAAEVPTWVHKGSGLSRKTDAKAFYGVGSVTGLNNEHLAWATAENRARAELARTFETYLAVLMRDYAVSTKAGDVAHDTEEQFLGVAITAFRGAALEEVRVVERYTDAQTGAYHVLATLDLRDATRAMMRAQVNSRMIEFARDHAERVFDRLQKEENNLAR